MRREMSKEYKGQKVTKYKYSLSSSRVLFSNKWLWLIPCVFCLLRRKIKWKNYSTYYVAYIYTLTRLATPSSSFIFSCQKVWPMNFWTRVHSLLWSKMKKEGTASMCVCKLVTTTFYCWNNFQPLSVVVHHTKNVKMFSIVQKPTTRTKVFRIIYDFYIWTARLGYNTINIVYNVGNFNLN